jgi:(2Fe-2S) ferredoxin
MFSPPSWKRHLFFCTGNKCQGKGSEDLKLLAQDILNQTTQSREILITKSGCLDLCDYGPIALLYPEGKWFSTMDEKSTSDMIDQILNGRDVLPRNIIYQIPGKDGLKKNGV